MTESESEEIKRYFDIVAESLRSDIQLVAEGHQVLREEISRLRCEVIGEVHELGSLVKQAHSLTDQRLASLEQARQETQDRLRVVEDHLAHESPPI